MVDVTIAGAGPVGLWAAGELARRGHEVVVIEKLESPTPHSKALTVHPRTLELFAQRGLIDEPLSAGIKIPNGHFANLPDRMDFSVLDTPFPYTLLYSQENTEILLEKSACDFGVDIRRRQEVVQVIDGEDSVTVAVRDGDRLYTIESTYLIGADGPRSTVREAVGIPFEGRRSRKWGLMADLTLDNPPELPVVSIDNEAGGMMLVPLPGRENLHRIVGAPRANGNIEPEFEAFRDFIVSITGTDYGMRDPIWLSKFGDATRIAANYRKGRILLAGDAAHIHLPAGGVGMNVGIQDASNLAWRLADVLDGYAPASALDLYNEERRPVGLDLLLHTKAQSALMEFNPEGIALRTVISRMIATVPSFSQALAERLCGFSVSYHADGHQLAGTRAPDLPLEDGTTLFSALTASEPVFVIRSGQQALATANDVASAANIVIRNLSNQQSRSSWGAVTAALIRPDGYVAWASELAGADLDKDATRAVGQLRGPRST